MKVNLSDATINGVQVQDGIDIFEEAGNYFIQVQPTFLYESFCNLCLLTLIMLFRKKKKYHGEVFLWYMCGYGAIRAVIEGFRTDQLQIGDTGIAVSQVLGATIAVVAGAIIVYMRIKKKDQPSVWKNPVVEIETTTEEHEANVASTEEKSDEEAEALDEKVDIEENVDGDNSEKDSKNIKEDISKN